MAKIRPTAQNTKQDARFRHVVFAQNQVSNTLKVRRINLTKRVKATRIIKLDTTKSDISEVIIRAGVCSSTSILLMIDASTDHFTYVDLYCEEMANLRLVAFLSGSALNHLEINVHLHGYSANAKIGMVCIPNHLGASVVHSIQDHTDRLTVSNLECRAVLTHETRMHYHGLISVGKNGVGTDAYQKNANVLLSDRAKVYSVPKLEISANDVRCTHGSTTSGLSADELFYVSSRGLNPIIAKRTIAHAFLAPVANMLQNRLLKVKFNDLIERNIADIIK